MRHSVGVGTVGGVGQRGADPGRKSSGYALRPGDVAATGLWRI